MLKGITVKSFIRAVRRLRFKRRDRTAQKANACRLSGVEVCLCDKFPGKPQQYLPDKGWRLLARIGYTSPTAKVDQTHDIELNEELLERIDFLACLFAGRRINK
jgi:hypothetical protein